MKAKLNPREEQILLSLKRLDYLNRDQLQKIHRLGEVRNANRVLKGLSDYLSKFRDEYSTIYYLNADGREYTSCEKVRKKTQFVNHVIMRNYYFMFAGFPSTWKNEMKISDGETTIICDAFYKEKGMYNCLEVDSTQRMSENRKKIEKYRRLYVNKAVENHLGHFPKLIWVTTTEFRRKQLTTLCKGLISKVYTIDEIK